MARTHSNSKNGLKNRQDGSIAFHPKSVNFEKARLFRYPWVVYFQAMKSKKVLLHDSCMVSPLSLILFGPTLKYEFNEASEAGPHLLEIDSLIKFRCNEETYNIVRKLKNSMDYIVKSKIASPGKILWDQDEGKVLQCIIELLVAEKNQ